MLHLIMLLASVLPLLLLLCFKPHKSQPKTCVQESSGGGNKPPSKRTFASGAPQPQSNPRAPHSSGREQQNSTMTAPQRPNQPAAGITVAAASKPRDKKKEPPSSGGGSHVAKRRTAASSAKLAKSQSKTKEKKLLQLLKTPKRRNRGDSLEAFTCEDVRSRERTEELTQIANSEGESKRGDLPVDVTAQTKELEFSMVTAEDEGQFEEAKYHVLGNVDELWQDQGSGDDWVEYIGDRLQSEGSVTCDQPTDRETSALICGHYRIWLAEKLGSALDAENPAPDQ